MNERAGQRFKAGWLKAGTAATDSSHMAAELGAAWEQYAAAARHVAGMGPRRLVGLERPSVAVLAPTLGNRFAVGVLAGVRAAARSAGVSVIAAQTLDATPASRSRRGPTAGVTPPLGDALCGVIVLEGAATPERLARFSRAGQVVVSVCHNEEPASSLTVSADNRGGIEAAVTHLLSDHGHRELTFVGALNSDDLRERYHAYLAALLEHGVRADDEERFIELRENSVAAGAAAGRALLAAGMPASAVVAATDEVAIGLIGVVREAGLVVPKDLAVVGFDDIAAARSASWSLSSVHQDLGVLGASALWVLVAAAERGVEALAPRTRVPTTFVRRSSCGCGEQGRQAPGPAATPRQRARQRLLGSYRAAGCSPLGQIDAPIEQLLCGIEDPTGVHPSALEALAGQLSVSLTRLEQVAEILSAGRAYAAGLHGAVSRALPMAPSPERERLLSALAIAMSRRVLAPAEHQVAAREADELDPALLGFDDPRTPRLALLGRTSVQAGLVALWRDDDARLGELEIRAWYHKDRRSPFELGTVVAAEHFPPQSLFDLVGDGEHTSIIPLRSPEHDFGVLALLGPLEATERDGDDVAFRLAEMLTRALLEQRRATSAFALLAVLPGLRSHLSPAPTPRAKAATVFSYDVNTGTVTFGAGQPSFKVNDWLGQVHEDDRHVVVEKLRACLRGHSGLFSSEHRVRAADGTTSWSRWQAIALPGSSSPAQLLLGAMADISGPRRERDTTLAEPARDPRSGLANRDLMVRRAEQLLADARERSGRCAVLAIELHAATPAAEAGTECHRSELALAIARRLRRAVADPDAVGQLGEDAYVVVLDDRSPIPSADIVAERVRDALADPFVLGGLSHHVSPVIGVAELAEGTAEQLFRRAQLALSIARGDQDRTAAFVGKPERRTSDQMRLERELATAITHGQLRILFQPIVELEGRGVGGMEALVRWKHPRLGLVKPRDFLAIAESSGELAGDLGRFVLREACFTAASWQRSRARLTVSVNLSMRHLEHEDLLSSVKEALIQSGIAPYRLVLEVSESTVLRDPSRALSRLAALRGLGVAVALDNFGSAYSTFARADELPIDVLKIDGSFVTKLSDSAPDEAIVKMFVAFGRRLGLTIVAQGTESEAQLQALRRSGVDYAQGILFGGPYEQHKLWPYVASTIGVRPGTIERQAELPRTST